MTEDRAAEGDPGAATAAGAPAAAPAATSIDEYIAGFPPEVRRVLEGVRAVVREAYPEAAERISYRMPTFDLHGRVFIYFAGFKGHVGMYPIVGKVEEVLGDELAPYKHGKGTMRLALDEPLPVGLIRRVLEVRAGEIEAKRRK